MEYLRFWLSPRSSAARRLSAALSTCALLTVPALARAQSSPVPVAHIDAGDTAWMLVSAALVMLMVPGLALFYGGMVRAKNVLNMLMQSFVALGVVSVVWILWGYSLAFSPGNPFIGGLTWLGLHGVTQAPNPDYAPTIPHLLFMAYQMMFAVITPALISGAIAERMKFSTYVLFIALWVTFVYCPIAHWIWGHGGWLATMGVLDFAGGTVVHISSGISALVVCIMLGRRRIQGEAGAEELRPHNLPMTLIGTGLLWFGWFGFNAGSALSAGGLATAAFVNTHAAGAVAGLTWVIIEWFTYGRPTALGFATGAIAGLAAVTQASGFVTPVGALAIGVAMAFVSFSAIKLKNRFRYDDTLDVVGVHGVGGVLGALATGLFASMAVNAHGADGLLYGGGLALLGRQAFGVAVALAYAVVVTWLIVKALGATIGLRVGSHDEDAGLDLSQHGEEAYSRSEDEASEPVFA